MLDTVNERLRVGTRDIPLTRRAYALLAYLVARPRQLATTAEILAAVWPGVVVEDGQVRQFVADLRRTLGDDPKAPRLIETVRGRGYRWIGTIRLEPAGGPSSPPTPTTGDPPEGDARLAGLVRRLLGEGPPAGVVVMAPTPGMGGARPETGDGARPPAAEPVGIDSTALMAMARRLDARELLDIESAYRQLQGAVGVAQAVLRRAPARADPVGAGAGLGDLVDTTLAGLAASTGAGDFDRGLDAVERALAEIDRREAERAATVVEARRELLEAALQQELLRRDAFAAAERVLAIAALDAPGARPAWTAEARRRWQGFVDEGDRQGITLSLQVAVELARRRVESAADDAERGVALGELGGVLATVGERESGTETLLEAAETLARSLAAPAGADPSADRAALMAARSHVLGLTGQRLGRADVLREAVDLGRAALAARSRAAAPFDWAETQQRLGNALRQLGALEPGTDALYAALEAYGEALKVYTPAREPWRWARTKLGVGVAWSLVGRREGGTGSAHRAVAAYREALREVTREQAPLDWGHLQNNLGIELALIGELDDDPATLREAVAAYRAALEERRRDRAPTAWSVTQHNLGGVLRLLGERDRVDGVERLVEAVAAFREALRVHTRERLPTHWAATKSDLGMALIRLGERQADAAAATGGHDGRATLEEAARVLRQALEVRTRDRGELSWAMTTGDLGRALRALGEAEGSAARLRQAIDAFDAALDVVSPDVMPEEHRLIRTERERARDAQAALDTAAPPLRVVGGRAAASGGRGSAR